MKKTIQITTLGALSLSLLALAACQNPSQQQGQLIQPQTLSAQAVQASQPLAPSLSPKFQAKGRIQTQEHTLKVDVSLNDLERDFSTQALGCEQVAFAKISVAGVGMTLPIMADGADADGFLTVSGCEIKAQLSEVPYGLRLLTVELYDASQQLLSGSTLKLAFLLDTPSQTLIMDYPYLPTAQVMEILLAGTVEEQYFAQNASLSDLQNTVNEIVGSAPDYITHPALVNTTLLSQDFLNGQINSDLSVYRQSGNTLSLTVAGLVGNDKLRARLDDISSRAVDTANGSVEITGVYPEGSPNLSAQFLPGVGGAYTFSPTLPYGVSFTNAAASLTLTATPVAPTLEPIPANVYFSNQSLTLTGTHFHTNGGTTVTIGGQTVTITAITSTSITVTTPSITGSDLTVQVTVGDQSASTTIDISLPPMYVNDNASGNNDGTSWENAYTDLQSALAAASAGDVLFVAEGTYKPTAGADRNQSFVLKSGVKIYGGFDDTSPVTSPAERDVDTDISILSGDIGTVSTTSDNSYQVLSSAGITADSGTEINGFTVQDGNANGSFFPLNVGGGMYNDYNSSPTLSNVTFTSNSASDGGGGMFNNNSSSPVLNNVTFTSNSGGFVGGGMYNNSSNPVLSNVTFTSNSADIFGGGMYNNSSNPVLSNVTFASNTASGNGGGMYSANSNPILVNVLWYMSSLSGVTLNNPNTQTHYTTYDNGNVVIDDNQGINFFVNLADPDGANDTFGDSDDGLKLQNGVGFYNYGLTSHGSVTIPTLDITGASRTGYNTPGAYQANQ